MTSKAKGIGLILAGVAAGLASELGAMWLTVNQGGSTPYVFVVMVLNALVLGFMVGGVLFFDQAFKRGESTVPTMRHMGAAILILAGAIAVFQAIAVQTAYYNGVGYYTFWNYLVLAVGGFELIGGALALYNRSWAVPVAAGIAGYVTASFMIGLLGMVLIATAHMNEKRFGTVWNAQQKSTTRWQ